MFPSFRTLVKTVCIGVLLSTLFGVSEVQAAAGINRQINYQGKLFTSSGVPVSDGIYSIKFSIYDASVAGNRLWTAAGTTVTPNVISVTAQNGLFTVQLGDTSNGQNAFDINWNQDALYLGVTIESDSEMSPRKRLTAVPYAFMAESLQGQFASSSVASAGGTLFSLEQHRADAALAQRTVLRLSTEGTSNANDFLLVGSNGSDVFTISRQGNVTASLVSSTSILTNTLQVGGSSVCLMNGADCPAGASVWTDDTTSAFVSLTTATRDVVIGSAASATSPFYFDVGAPSSTFQIGRSGNANVLVGTSTYGGGLASLFTLHGEDVFVQGKIGALGGMISPIVVASGGDDGAIQTKGFLFSVNGSVTSSGLIANASGATVTIKSAGANIADFSQSVISLWNPVYLNSSLETGPIIPHASTTTYDIGSSVYPYGIVFATTVSSTQFIAGNNGMSVNAGQAGLNSGRISNSASNTVAVLDVTGGCDDGNAGTDLFLVGNNADARKFSIRCNGDGHMDGTLSNSGADFAEYFRITNGVSLSPGDSVALIHVAGSSLAALADHSTREQTLGVVSMKPGFLGNGAEGRESDPHYLKVALQGQVPTRVSASLGAINVGDVLMVGDGGVAVKAQGPGMILGRAMEALLAGVGTIQVYVQPSWWAGDVLSVMSGNVHMTQPLVFASSTDPTPATPYIDSPAFTFQGAAWNADSNSIVTSSFTLKNDVMSSASSLFGVYGQTGTTLLTISALGNVAITGDLMVGHRLYLGSKMTGQVSTSTYVFVDDTLAPASTYIATNADGWQTGSTYDYAERFHSIQELRPGDVVATDQKRINFVRRSVSSDDVILGIVSTKPGFVTGAYASGTYPIALAGRVPTRVSTAQGAIHPGDLLTASHVPGVAVKANGPGSVVGVALEFFDLPGEGLISVFVQPGWKGGEIVASPSSPSAPVYVTSTLGVALSPRRGLAKIIAGSTEVRIQFATLSAYPLITVTPYELITANWGVTQVTDHGFTITLTKPMMADVVFAWKAEPSQEGDRMSFSDGTSAIYDPTSGLPVIASSTPPTVSSTPEVLLSSPVIPDALVQTSSDSAASSTPPEVTVSSTPQTVDEVLPGATSSTE